MEAATGTSQIEAPLLDYEKEFKTVQIQARFPDGLAGWTKFLEKNLNRDLPVNNGVPAGIYTVVVSFVVNKEGVISEVQAETDPGFGTSAEAVRAIKKGPNWIPAEQNGTKVIYRQRRPLALRFLRTNSFLVQDWFHIMVLPSHETLFLQKQFLCLQNLLVGMIPLLH